MKKEQKQEDLSPKERELESQALEDTTNSGSITIDNVDILDLSENALRDNIAVITQAPYIFNATTRNNMLFVKKDATDDEIWEVLKMVQIDNFVRSLDKGLDSFVGWTKAKACNCTSFT